MIKIGTDIHALVEISRDGLPWRPLRGEFMPRKGSRNYVLFALLSDVRNHGGLHEAEWQEPRTVEVEGESYEIPGWWYEADDGGHDRIEPIDKPRGVPDDATMVWKAFVTAWKSTSNAVDTTWLTPEEIIAADWDQDVYSYGVLREEEYLQLRDHGVLPTLHPASAGGPGLITVNEVEYAAGKRGERATCISARWKSGTVREHCGAFREMVKEMLTHLPDGSKLRFMLLFES